MSEGNCLGGTVRLRTEWDGWLACARMQSAEVDLTYAVLQDAGSNWWFSETKKGWTATSTHNSYRWLIQSPSDARLCEITGVTISRVNAREIRYYTRRLNVTTDCGEFASRPAKSADTHERWRPSPNGRLRCRQYFYVLTKKNGPEDRSRRSRKLNKMPITRCVIGGDGTPTMERSGVQTRTLEDSDPPLFK